MEGYRRENDGKTWVWNGIERKIMIKHGYGRE